MGYNKIILEGRLTKNIELKYLQGGKALAKTTIAVNKKYTDASGNKQENVLFTDIQIWGRFAEVVNEFCRKGSRVLIDGELANNNWTGQDGKKNYGYVVNVNTLEMLDNKTNANSPQKVSSDKAINESLAPTGYDYSIDINEDEIPF